MGPVRIRHSSHDFGWPSSHSVDLAGWQAKMASIKFGYHVVMGTSPIAIDRNGFRRINEEGQISKTLPQFF